MVDHMRPISLAALYNLSITAERGNDRLFTIDEIAEAAQPFPTVGYNDLRSSLGTYLAGAVRSGDPYFAGDRYRGLYELTEAGKDFQNMVIGTAVAARQQNERTTARAPMNSSRPSSTSSSSRFIPGTLVRSAAIARDSDDDDEGVPDDSAAAPAACHKSTTRKLALLSSSSAQRSENHPSETGKLGYDQQSSSSASASSSSSPSSPSSPSPSPSSSFSSQRVGEKRKAKEIISSGSTRGSRAESGLGVIYGLPIEFLVQGRSRHESTAAAAAAASSSQQAKKKRKAEMISPSPVRERRFNAKPGSSSSSSAIRPASSSQSTVKRLLSRGHSQPVEQYNLATGRTIAQFDSQMDATRATGIPNSSISLCPSGILTHAGGYGWRRPGTGTAGLTRRKGSSYASKPSTGTYSSRLFLLL